MTVVSHVNSTSSATKAASVPASRLPPMASAAPNATTTTWTNAIEYSERLASRCTRNSALDEVACN